MGLTDFADEQQQADSVDLRLTSLEYTDSYGQPRLHLFGRDSNRNKWHVEVDGHEPSFFIREEEYSERLDNHYAVSWCEHGYEGLHGESLVRVYTYLPKQVGELREMFEKSWEADVFFTNRFLLDKGVYTGVSVDMSGATEVDGEHHVRVFDGAVTATEAPDVQPRVLTTDIEIASEVDKFPGPLEAAWPVSVIATHDSYTGEYRVLVLRSDEWPINTDPDFQDSGFDYVEVFDHESVMLAAYHDYVERVGPDLLSGWNSEAFDYPYLVQRSRNHNIWLFEQWSPLGDVWVSQRFNDLSAVVKGVPQFDMMRKYEKTQYHKLKSKALDDVAAEELGVGKIELELSHNDMWKFRPETFIEYAHRDVEAVVEVDREVGILELFEKVREISGAQYGEMEANFNVVDMMVLHEAKDRGIRLPTSTPPDKDWYYGAFVFTPKAGLHYNVVYPDLLSLYPNMMRQCNMSPETLVGTRSDLFVSEYDEDDCVWSYVDTRPVKRVGSGADISEYQDGTFKAVMKRKKDGTWKTAWVDDPEYTKLYFLKPEVKEGFVASVVEKIMTLTDEYEGFMYEAVKRIRNSVYGVFGDSNSYGKGFRLFDVRMAEAITLGGRKVLQYSAEKFVNEANRLKEERGLFGNDAYLVGGDTDSAMTSLDFFQYRAVSEDVTEILNESYDDFCKEMFGLDEHYMDIEVESYSDRAFFVQDEGEPEGVAKKKRYAMTSDEEEPYGIEEDMIIKGFHMVRSDVSRLTAEAQEYTFEKLLYEDQDDARRLVYEWLKEVVRELYSGEYDLNKLGIPFGIGQELSEYGDENRTPSPQYRGAKYANENIYGEQAISEGTRGAKYYYVVPDKSRTYSADTPEDGREVDAISVLDAEDIPDDMTIDMEKMIEKTLEVPMEAIFDTLGWDWSVVEDEIAKQETDMGLESFM